MAKQVSYDAMEWRFAQPEAETEQEWNQYYAKRQKQLQSFLTKVTEELLTEKQRQCLNLYYYQGIRQKEIAKQLGVAPSVVCRHLKRAKEKLSQIAGFFPG